MVNLFSLLPEKLIAAWWNVQWKKALVVWDLGKNGKEDVRESFKFTKEDDALVDELLASLGPLPKSEDSRVIYIVVRLLDRYAMGLPVKYGGDYKRDIDAHKKPDYWQNPAQTISLGKGDCDDWMILIYACLRRAGIPAYRLKGEVLKVIDQGKDSGWHANLLYLAREDYEWYHLEGSWYPESARSRFLRQPAKQNTDLYGQILFTFNEEHTWAQTDFSIKPAFLKPEAASKKRVVRR